MEEGVAEREKRERLKGELDAVGRKKRKGR